MNICNLLFVLLLAVSCAPAQAEPIFIDDEACDDCGAVVIDPQGDTDASGNIEGSDGSKWKEGADGRFRSDDGQECEYSKSLEEWSCEK